MFDIENMQYRVMDISDSVDKIRSVNRIAYSSLSRLNMIRHFKPERVLEDANQMTWALDSLLEGYDTTLNRWLGNAGSWDYHLEHALSYTDFIGKEGFERVRKAGEEMVSKKFSDLSYFWKERFPRLGLADVPSQLTDIVEEAAEFAGLFAGFQVLKGLDTLREYASEDRILPNPYSYLIRLYEMGLRPTFNHIDKRPIVDIPLVIDGKPVLGCYAYKDKKILRKHEWTTGCKKASQLE
jgi:hypothetical protein